MGVTGRRGGLFEDWWAAGVVDDGMGDPVGLGVIVSSEVGDIELVDLHHGQVVAQEAALSVMASSFLFTVMGRPSIPTAHWCPRLLTVLAEAALCA